AGSIRGAYNGRSAGYRLRIWLHRHTYCTPGAQRQCDNGGCEPGGGGCSAAEHRAEWTAKYSSIAEQRGAGSVGAALRPGGDQSSISPGWYTDNTAGRTIYP